MKCFINLGFMYGYNRLSMAIYCYVWLYRITHGYVSCYVGLCMAMYSHVWVYMVMEGFV